MPSHSHTRSGNNGAVDEGTGVGWGSEQESAYAMAKADLFSKTHGRFSRPGTITKIQQVLYLEDRTASPERRWEVMVIARCLLPNDEVPEHRMPNRGHKPGKR